MKLDDNIEIRYIEIILVLPLMILFYRKACNRKEKELTCPPIICTILPYIHMYVKGETFIDCM